MDLSNQDNDLSLIIGHNNSGKTSFVKIFEEFFLSSTPSFSFDNFPLTNRKAILEINEETNEYDLSIKLIVEVEYSKEDTDIPNLQSFITTHSSHIVKNSDFKSLRYFSISEDNIEIKNFYTELKLKYEQEESEDELVFVGKYLTIASTELFFAKKIIFIEGLTERLLLPYFIKQFDNDLSDKETKLSSQNISILEVGVNAKAFKHFIDFLKIKTLIITDIDTT